MREPGAPRSPLARSSSVVREGPPKRSKLEPLEFAGWVERRVGELGERWLGEVASRQARQGTQVDPLLTPFFTLLASMVPANLGPYRQHVEPFWQQAAELYGSVAAQRGLAAGEGVEEFQILREVLIRELYADPPAGGQIPLALRDVLRLNRLIDRGVTQVSVGHADVLFFALFQGSGVPEKLSAEVRQEITSQLESIGEEFRAVMASLPH
jgi:hypothetical protein